MAFKRIHQTEAISYNARPQHVAVADFNRDDHQDLVIVNTGFDNIGIRLEYGNGTFGNHAIGDFNKDGTLDLVVLMPDRAEIAVCFGLWDGGFNYGTTYSLETYSQPRSIVVADFNNDMILDIAVGYFVKGIGSIAILYGLR